MTKVKEMLTFFAVKFLYKGMRNFSPGTVVSSVVVVVVVVVVCRKFRVAPCK